MSFEKLHFTSSDGETEIVVPFFQDAVKRRDMKKIKDEAKEVGGLDAVDEERYFEAAKLDKGTIAKLDDLTVRDYNEFIRQWLGDGETLGK